PDPALDPCAGLPLGCRRSSSFLRRSPRPPLSPLFPYTTLFRSHRKIAWGASVPYGEGRGVQQRGVLHPSTARSPTNAGSRLPCSDRKSTRLNSSHVKNSYAVFCLKKKSQVAQGALNLHRLVQHH